MMTLDTKLKVMAYLDGELPSGEARALAELLEREPAARALHDELKATRTLLKGNEPELNLPEPRDFYWSKIRRQIERETPVPRNDSRATASSWWVRFAVPAGALAALVVVVSLALRSPTGQGTDLAAFGLGHEIDTPTDEVSSFTFRSETAAMTVVWVDSHRN